MSEREWVGLINYSKRAGNTLAAPTERADECLVRMPEIPVKVYIRVSVPQ